MDIANRELLRPILSCRRNTIVGQWCCTLTQAGFSIISIGEIYRRLETCVDQCIALLLGEQFDRAGAEFIGSTLADWHCIQPEVLGQTQSLLLRAFTADMPADYVVALMPNLVALVEAIATGFNRRSQQYIIGEQEQILGALLAERMSVMKALRASEEGLRTIVTNLPIIVFSVNREGVVTLIEGRSLEMLGHDASTFIGRSIFNIAQIQPQMLANARRALAGETFTDTLSVRDIVFETRYAPLRSQDGQVYGLIGVAMDVTERRLMEVELAEARYFISEGREDERRRIARDLHDGVVQQLLGLSYQLAEIQQRVHNAVLPDSQLMEELSSIQKAVQRGMLDVVVQLRHSISELRPAGLDDLGLTMALETFVAQLEQEAATTSPAIELDLDWAGPEIPLPVAHCLFRVAQESLRNALRYAQASHIAIILRIYDKTAMVRVVDNGIGFKMPPQITQFIRAQHFGLVGLLEQVECLHGSFSIWSEPGEGAEVTAELPLSRNLLMGIQQEQATADTVGAEIGLVSLVGE